MQPRIEQWLDSWPKSVEIVGPLYTSTKGGNEPLIWTETKQRHLRLQKPALTLAPALVLPDVSKHFHLFVHETKAEGGFNSNFGAMEMLYDIPV